MPSSPPADMIGRRNEWSRLSEFATSGAEHPTLGIAWGRRRVGKSFLLQALTRTLPGFYYEATRGSEAEALRDLGTSLGAFRGAAGPIALDDWGGALDALLSLGEEQEVLVVLDEFPYLLEHSPSLDSLLQRALGPAARRSSPGKARLVLCGSAMTLMKNLLGGTAPLRGRAGLDLRICPFHFRLARELHRMEDLATAVRTFAVIGGVGAYAREMVDGDLPSGASDFHRWVCRRVLSPSAPLFHEVGLLLAEDPSTSKARKINLYHATLAGIATGHHAHAKLAGYVKIPGASLAPIVDALVASEFVEKIQDPIRANRPTYHPSDPLIRFHYAILRRNQSRLTRHDSDTRALWRQILPIFESQVLGPSFEGMARYWTAHFAAPETLGALPDQVGPTTVVLGDGTHRQVDVVAVRGQPADPENRGVLALGEANGGELMSRGHLSRLEQARAALGPTAQEARLLLFGTRFSPGLMGVAARRPDLEIIDLERLYHGS
jgi:uncharacterized protein